LDDFTSEIGANSADDRFTDSVVEEIKDKVKPRVIVWFGTCEITQKKGKNISLRTPPPSLSEY
jgi:hypothetical protein